MKFKKSVSVLIAFIIMATQVVAMSGCDDLGVYEDVEEYYSALGDVVLISGTSKEKITRSVETYFYNKESREDFLEGEERVAYSDYVYVAIPFNSSIDMDSFALYLMSENDVTDVTVYINVFVTDKIPTAWKAIADNVINGEETGKVYDDPKPETRVGEITVHLKNGKWSSFLLDNFSVNGAIQKSIEIKEGQYILLQIRNNSGVRDFDEEKQIFIDPQTGLELQKAKITMTNLLIRALDLKNVDETQGGE